MQAPFFVRPLMMNERGVTRKWDLHYTNRHRSPPDKSHRVAVILQCSVLAQYYLRLHHLQRRCPHTAYRARDPMRPCWYRVT